MSADGGVRFTDLHAFNRDLLYAIRALERDGDAPKGLAIKDHLETEYDEEVNHSRLYQNLDALTDKGLVSKGTKDDRTNEYATTDVAREMLDRVTERRMDAVGLDVETDVTGGDDQREFVTDGGHDVQRVDPYCCAHCGETSPDPSATTLPCGCCRVKCPNCGRSDELHQTFCRADEVATDGGVLNCQDCGDEVAADDVKGLIQPDGEDAILIGPECQTKHPYDRQYAPADPSALLDEDGDSR
nr:helix-turn-helix transcriptional regulator [Halorussus aquaticus]